MVKRKLLTFFCINCTLISATSFAHAQEPQTKQRQDLRLYRINKDGIESRLWFTRGKARKTGCHNIRKRSRLYRAVQFGYSRCHIYTRKNCDAESAVIFTRKGAPEPTYNLVQGYSWFAISEHKRGKRIKSWDCSHRPTLKHK